MSFLLVCIMNLLISKLIDLYFKLPVQNMLKQNSYKYFYAARLSKIKWLDPQWYFQLKQHVLAEEV